MWEEVYSVFAKERATYDNATWENIYKVCDAKTHDSELEIPHQQDIEEAIGGGSHVVLVKYGINADEIKQNSEIVLGLESLLNENDELYVDITHSFRSLPLYVMNLLVYLRNVSPKRIKIKGIYYGMLDARREFKDNIAPIVELSDILNVNDWISGAYSFMQFGNADKIAELVNGINENLCVRLQQFSDTKNLNHLAELERQSQTLGNMLQQQQLPTIAQMLITPVIGDFVSRLTVRPDDPHRHSKFQSKLARWQYNNKNYLAAYISLLEAIITYNAEAYQIRSGNQIDVYNIYEREAVKEKLRNYNEMTINVGWKHLSREVSTKRNALAHNTRIEGGHNNQGASVSQEFIDSLSEFLGRYEQLANRQ